MSKRFSGKSSGGRSGGGMSTILANDMGDVADLRARNDERRRTGTRSHIPGQFPHFRSRSPHYCMCDKPCCAGEDGCVCTTCPCDPEKGHV